jgi:hypothetical protein
LGPLQELPTINICYDRKVKLPFEKHACAIFYAFNFLSSYFVALITIKDDGKIGVFARYVMNSSTRKKYGNS